MERVSSMTITSAVCVTEMLRQKHREEARKTGFFFYLRRKSLC